MSRHRLTSAIRTSAILLSSAPLPVFATDPPQGYSINAKLRQIASDLNTAVRRFQNDLDREIAVHDHGYRADNGHRVPPADTDIGDAPADIAQDSLRKLVAARMIAARRPGYRPNALADADALQSLIVQARTDIERANDIAKRFLTVSARQLNTPPDGDLKLTYRELLKTRAAAADAAKRALGALPIALPEGDSAETQRERAWDLIGPGFPPADEEGILPDPGRDDRPERDERKDAILPIRLQPGRRLTLVRDRFRRVSLTDSGIEDARGRRLFYEEEWLERQGDTLVKRWAVALDTATGQHTLLRRYAIRELPDTLDELYLSAGRMETAFPDRPETSSASSNESLTLALSAAQHAREQLHDAIADFRQQQQLTLARNDTLLAARNELPIDDDLSSDNRVTLFNMRAHLAGTVAMLSAENAVRGAREQAAARVRSLEAEAAWVGGESPDSRVLQRILDRSDAEIDAARRLEREAEAALPPGLSSPEARFPELMKDTIVRIRGMGTRPGGAVRLRQEVWRLVAAGKGARRAERIVVLIDIEPASGRQLPVSREVKTYALDAGDNLETIYDEFAAQ